MRNYFAYTLGLAPPTVSPKGMHRGWAKMAAGVELEAYRQDGAVLKGMCLVAGETAHGDTSSSWVRSAVVGPVVGYISGHMAAHTVRLVGDNY